MKLQLFIECNGASQKALLAALNKSFGQENVVIWQNGIAIEGIAAKDIQRAAQIAEAIR